MPPRTPKQPLSVEALKHASDRRTNIPTAEFESVMDDADRAPVHVAYERRNRDLDPQLVWRGKDEQDWSDLVVPAPPLYIQEKIHPKVLVDELRRQSQERADAAAPAMQLDLFADFNGVADTATATEFYKHDANWTNRMILGDSLQVMASLAEREGLRGKVQCIYIDPPYGIKFNSNFQWSTTSRDVKDGNREHITREPEQVRAFRDTWRDGIHSYLTYLRDRLTVARDLLTDSGSIFVQIGDENVHRVRAVMDEVFGEENFVSLIPFKKTTGAGSPSGGTEVLASISDYLVWFAKRKDTLKYRQMYRGKEVGGEGGGQYSFIEEPDGSRRRASKEELLSLGPNIRVFRGDQLTSQSSGGPQFFSFILNGREFAPKKSGWKTTQTGMRRLLQGNRVIAIGNTPSYVRYINDFPAIPLNNTWEDTVTSGFGTEKVYVVQTNVRVIERCLLMTTDPGDLVLDPTCGSGTTAYVAEQWGRRWITIDTSRVALALARARIMGARYPYYLLQDSKAGQQKEADVTRSAPSSAATYGNIRHGFVYERVPHITLKSIANNAEIDVIWDKWQATLEPLRAQLNAALGKTWEEWEIPRELPAATTNDARLKTAPTGDGGTSDDARLRTAPTAGGGTSDDARLKPAPTGDGGTSGDARLKPAPTGDGGTSDDARLKTAPTGDGGTSDDARLKTAPTGDGGASDDARLKTAPTGDEGTSGDARLKTAPTGDGGTSGDARLKTAPTGEAITLHRQWWDARIARQREIDASIAAKAEFEYLYDKPYDDRGIVRVAGPFTVESLSPHRILAVDEHDELIPHERFINEGKTSYGDGQDFTTMILDNLKTAGVQQAHKEDRISFTALEGWPGKYICAEGRYQEGDNNRERRAGIFVGPEFGTVPRADLVAAAREAGDAGFDVLIACAFNYDAHAAEFEKLGRVPVLKARMNADLHMGDTLKNTGAGNLFVIFGEPDIAIQPASDGQVQVKLRGVDVFRPQSGEVTSSGPDEIACWFIDTDYNEESFFVRQAYFLGANDPYKALKTTLKAEIDEEAWASLYGDTSRPFSKPSSGRIAVKVINHLGDEVMKVFSV